MKEHKGNNDSEVFMLLQRVSKYLRASRTSPSRFGQEAVNDPCFVFDLQAGREPRARTVARVEAYLARVEQTEVSR